MKYGAIAVFGAILLVMVGMSFMSPHIILASSYEKSQFLSQTNECGIYWFPVNVICSNLNSQVQGDENNVAMTTATNEKIEPDTNFGPPFP
jgi:hypothetical protein